MVYNHYTTQLLIYCCPLPFLCIFVFLYSPIHIIPYRPKYHFICREWTDCRKFKFKFITYTKRLGFLVEMIDP